MAVISKVVHLKTEDLDEVTLRHICQNTRSSDGPVTFRVDQPAPTYVWSGNPLDAYNELVRRGLAASL